MEKFFDRVGQFASSIISFLTRKPDRRGIVLLEDSVLWGLHHEPKNVITNLVTLVISIFIAYFRFMELS